GFNEFKSVISQNKLIVQALPIQIDKTDESDTGYGVDYIYEPSGKEILERIIPLHLNTQMWRAVLESNASEQGARMAAMDNATENASEIMRQLKLKYNQARQAAITTEISEIVSGAEALNN
ncbi:MAG: F0F1 ATP synthase subunit gamma, partial [Balneolales bacterium]|nr:F0F1 ATP synthase subunit gamma [Balneolales bacterium]